MQKFSDEYHADYDCWSWCDSAKYIFDLPNLEFNFSKKAVEVNSAMPLVTVNKLDKLLGTLSDKSILLLGVSYLPNVADTRYSGSQIFYQEAERRGAKVIAHDPIVEKWEELNIEISPDLPSSKEFDAIVFAVGHHEYQKEDWQKWLGENKPLIFDANNVLTQEQRNIFRENGCQMSSIGRGEHCE